MARPRPLPDHATHPNSYQAPGWAVLAQNLPPARARWRYRRLSRSRSSATNWLHPSLDFARMRTLKGNQCLKASGANAQRIEGASFLFIFFRPRPPSMPRHLQVLIKHGPGRFSSPRMCPPPRRRRSRRHHQVGSCGRGRGVQDPIRRAGRAGSLFSVADTALRRGRALTKRRRSMMFPSSGSGAARRRSCLTSGDATPEPTTPADAGTGKLFSHSRGWRRALERGRPLFVTTY